MPPWFFRLVKTSRLSRASVATLKISKPKLRSNAARNFTHHDTLFTNLIFARESNPRRIGPKLLIGRTSGVQICPNCFDVRSLGNESVPNDTDRTADFSLSNSSSKTFPPGDYKIDVYLDDELIQTVRYKVQ
jgi:hypothetical protein